MRQVPMALVFAACVSTAPAQWLDHRAPDTPRTRDGKANLTAPTPRTRHGKPDLSGVWHAEVTPVEEWRRKIGNESVNERMNATGAGMGIGTVSI